MKKSFKLVLAILVMLIIIVYSKVSYAAEPFEMFLDKSEIVLNGSDDTFSFQIQIYDPTGHVIGIYSQVVFDPNIIELTNIVPSENWSAGYPNLEKGILSYTRGPGPLVNGKEVYATVYGKIKKTNESINTTISVENIQYAVEPENPWDETDFDYTEKNLSLVVNKVVVHGDKPDYKDPIVEEPEKTPSPSGTPVPSTSGTPVPSTSGTPVPSTSGTPVPSTSGTPVPSTSGTPVPSASGTQTPSTTTTPKVSTTPDGTTIPTDKTPQAGTGKTVAVVMGVGVIGCLVFYVKFSKNNY